MEARKRLEQALSELLCETGYKGVTVTELCKRAGVSRKTFYKLFQDKNELLESFFDSEIYAPFLHLIDYSRKHDLSPKTVALEYFEHAYSHKDLYRGLLTAPEPYSLKCLFVDRVQKLNRTLLQENMQGDDAFDENYLEYASFYSASAWSSFFAKWLEEGMQIPPEELVEIYYFSMRYFPGRMQGKWWA